MASNFDEICVAVCCVMSLFSIIYASIGSLKRFGVLLLFLTFLCVLPFVIYKFNPRISSDGDPSTPSSQLLGSWILQLFLNICGYATVIVPGALAVQYLKNSDFLQNEEGGWFSRALHLCVKGSPGELPQTYSSPNDNKSRSLCQQGLVLCFCTFGLLGSYLVWGLLQERIMAIRYEGLETGKEEHFKNSLFLEFMNRILSVFVASMLLFVIQQPTHQAPLYAYSYSAFSNVMSSWCQYEALKYVSFPVQVLAKASKVIPVMLMGKLVSKQTYSWFEYSTALMLSLGLFLFLFNSEDSLRHKGREATLSGILLMCGYLLFDSFTSNWQGALFSKYRMSHIQMMAGSNAFSVVFASVSLLEQGGFTEAFDFMTRHPLFIFHITFLASTSTVGQLFIFYTIHEFGPVTFTIIMTVRQAIAILLSCLFYHHPVHLLGVLGIIVFFMAIFIRFYHSQSLAKRRKAATSERLTQNSSSVVPELDKVQTK